MGVRKLRDVKRMILAMRDETVQRHRHQFEDAWRVYESHAYEAVEDAYILAQGLCPKRPQALEVLLSEESSIGINREGDTI